MNLLAPVYTEKRQCQDCYKCVRNCPVKAIKIEGGYATVIPELCTFCGTCVTVCPSGAKKVRDDLPAVRQVLAAKERVYVSLAPSWVTALPGVRAGQVVAGLRRLGLAGVSETALGAQEVSAHVAEMLGAPGAGVMISSACPAVVEYLRKHRLAEAGMLTPLLSPAQGHARMLRRVYGEDIGVVFVGPCVAKKVEADARPDLIDAALTFEDLRQWLAAEKVDLAAVQTGDGDHFVPERATDGAIYAVDGGMIAGVRANCPVNDRGMMAFSGFGAIERALEGIGELPRDRGMLLELLACEGGCVNGPRIGRASGTAVKRFEVLSQAAYVADGVPRRPGMRIEAAFEATSQTGDPFTDPQVRAALRVVGKFSADDEMNCGGCGYDSCRQFGVALLREKAERSQCVTYMRQLAHKKANALIQKMPSAVVIVDATLRVVEHNAAFARLVGESAGGTAAEPAGSYEGRALAEILPFHRLFGAVLRTGEDLLDKDLRFRETILHASIFTIEKHAVVGAILQDITRPAVQKEQVIRKAREVIRRNLETVQQIAYLLGENASESEITLSSIIESFSPPKPEKADETGNDGGQDWRKRYRKN